MMRGVIEFAVPKRMFAKCGAYQDKRSAGDLGGLHGAADVGERPLDDQLIRPSRAVHNDDRAICAIKRRQLTAYFRQIVDG